MSKLPYLPEYKWVWMKTKEGKWVKTENPCNSKYKGK